MSSAQAKEISSLRVSDLEKFPVWQFANEDVGDGTAVRPIKRLPVSALGGKVVGTRVRLGNGNYVWALISNLDLKNAQMNEHFVTLSIERNANWFGLARYHDIDYQDHGPDALARFLELSVDDVFPIHYNVRKYVKGGPTALEGNVMKEPRIRLSREEIIALAVP